MMAGFLVKSPQRVAEFSSLQERVKTGLSRYHAESISSYFESGFSFSHADIGAHETSSYLHRNGTGLIALCGDPLGNNFLRSPSGLGLDENISLPAKKDFSPFVGANGQYCATIFNVMTRTVFLVADKLSTRPVYYYDCSEFFVFTTSLRHMKFVLGEHGHSNPFAVAQVAALGQLLGDVTGLSGVKRLRGGEAITVTPSNTNLEKYWKWDELVPLGKLSIEESAATVVESFHRAIQRRLVAGQQDAFLSGGMDSRSVVAGILKFGEMVRTFNVSSPGMADMVLGQQVAEALGTSHHQMILMPNERVKWRSDPFGIYATKGFPLANTTILGGGRKIWSGDGGSVLLGHVYLTQQMISKARALGAAGFSSIISDRVHKFGSRLVTGHNQKLFIRHAIEAVELELCQYHPKEPGKLPLLFYLLNDQSRHLDQHFESIDLHRVELLTPFFDAEFVANILQLPIDYFLQHKLYNLVAPELFGKARTLPWQVYPGHVPCPIEIPPGVGFQWDRSRFQTREVYWAYAGVIEQLLSDCDQSFGEYVSKGRLKLLTYLLKAGVGRWVYEVELARSVHETIGARLQS